MCAAVSVKVCFVVGRGREKLMCATLSVMVCYRLGETK